MYINNKVFRKITAPFINNPSAKKGTQYSYPAIVLDTGEEFIISSLNYENRPDLPFNIPFTFHFEYRGNIIHEDNVTDVWFYVKAKESDNFYSRQYVPGRIFELTDISDFCLMFYKACSQRKGSRYDIVIYRNYKLFTKLHDVEEIKHKGVDPNGSPLININRFRFDRIAPGYSRNPLLKIKKIAVINGKEYTESNLNLSFGEWNELFSDSDNSYCDLKNLYSNENELPYDAKELKWNSEAKIHWHCYFGHSWEMPISKYTKYLQYDNPCPKCRKLLPGLTPRVHQFGAGIVVTTVNDAMIQYKEKDLGRLRRVLENDCKKTRGRLEEAIESHSSLWFQEAEMPSQIKYYFVHPNGIQSDIDMHICETCGSVNEIQEFLYEAVIPVEHKDELVALYGNTWITEDYKDTLLEKYSETEALKIINNTELSEFLTDHHLFFKYASISPALKFLTRFSLNPQELDRELNCLRPNTREYRQEIYNQVVFAGKSSGRWVSEQSLYRLVRCFFADAIYQYHAPWLGYQSLDIYIPSIHVGLEYQGAQHYEAVDIFGGEEALKDRKALDAKKRKLCKKNNVTLIEWKYTKEITRQAVFEALFEWLGKEDVGDSE